MRYAFLLAAVLPALVGAVLGGIAYFAPETGVAGTPGALLALVGAVAVTLGALAIPRLGGGWRGLFLALCVAGALLTAAAAWFLMQLAFAAVMALAALGILVLAAALPNRRTA